MKESFALSEKKQFASKAVGKAIDKKRRKLQIFL